MTNRSPEEIEREIEEERSALAGTLDQLQSQFSPERWMNEISRQVTDNGGAFSRQIGRAVRDNPIGLAVTGVGLALLLSNRSSGGTDNDDYGVSTTRRTYGTLPARPAASPLMATGDRYATESPSYDNRRRPVSPGFNDSYDPAEFDRRVRAATEDSFDDDDGDGSTWGSIKARMSDAGDRVAEAGENVRDKLSETGDAARTQADSVSASARIKARSARYRAGDLRDQAYTSAAEMRRTIARGTQGMTEEARRRVYRARLAAIDAQSQIEAQARHYGRRAQQTASDNPILMGLLAMGVGAVVGASLPRTDMEDDAVGAYRDQMLDEARRIYDSESEKLRHVAEAAAAEGKQVVQEELEGVKSSLHSSADGEKAVEAAESKTRTVAGRVADAAEKAAEKEKLGSSLTNS